jgi:hypothetical protein
VLEIGRKELEKDLALSSQLQLGLAHRTVRCARLVRVKRPLSGLDGGIWLYFTRPSGGALDCPVNHPWRTRRPREKQRGDVAIIHRTVRWANDRRRKRSIAQSSRDTWSRQRSAGGTGQCLVHQWTQSCNGRLFSVWKEIMHRTWTVVVRWCTGLSGAPHDRRQGLPSKFVFNGY